MANLKEQEKWEDGIYQIEENDPVLGGEEGVTNRPAKQLANRTAWLKKALSLLGLKAQPKTLTATSTNKVDEDGHSHAIDKASLTQQGIVQLTNALNSDAENLALTAKAGKALAQRIVDYIPNTKKSAAVNSTSTDTVATSAAVKTAYDKGVEAKTAADGAQRTANDGVAKAKTAQAAAEAAQRTANDGVSKATTAQNTANSAVAKADNAQRAADNANNNANGRVLKSGDTMIGMLKITGSSTTYQVNGYGWPKKIELSGDSVIGNEACVIGFNNNGTLHLGGKPNSSEFNVSIDETRLWVKGDVVTKSGASLNNAFMKTGGVVTGDTSFKQGDWSGISFFNNSGRYVRIESNPHSSNSMLSFVYRESNGSNINVANLPRKNGTILLDSDISHATNGTNKAKVASEFALGELNKTKANLADFSYQKIGNFEIRRYPDGTMIQTYFVDFYDVHGPNSGLGGTGQKQLTWAVSFIGKPLVWGNITSSIEDHHDAGVNILTKSTGTTLYWYNYEHGNPNQGACRLQFLAIGRWK